MSDPDRGETDADLHDGLRAVLRESRNAVLATVVAVDGAAYRRPGAKRLLTDPPADAAPNDPVPGDPSTTWRDILSSATGRLVRLDLSTLPADSWLTGLGGNGTVTLLFDPVDASLRPALDAVADGRRAVVCTALDGDDPAVDAGDRTVVVAGGDPAGPGSDSAPRTALPERVLDALADAVGPLPDLDVARTVEVATESGTVRTFCDCFDPVPELLVFGAAADVVPVARFGNAVGFRVNVVLPEAGAVDPASLPGAVDLTVADPADVADLVPLPARTHAVLMSHEFEADRDALAALLDTPVPYVGVLGPRKRFAGLRESLRDEVADDDFARVASPVGLDLGAESPAGVAMSVVSEALAVSNGREGGRLRDAAGAVHPRGGE